MASEYSGGKRRVLMLAYYFPPLGGAGVQRTLKFASYLPESGWQPTVLTTRSTVYPVKDPSLARELPAAVRVIRAHEPRGAMGPAAVLRWAGWERASRIAAFPDAAIGWVPDAVRLSLSVVRREHPAVLFSTSAPYSSHLVALAVHRRTGIPWIADFRDEWAANPSMRDEPPLVRRMARRLELEITRRAAAITVVGDYFQILNPFGSPIATIPNGVDDQDLEEPTSTRLGDALTLSYVGTLYGKRDAGPVINALQRLVGRGAIDLDRLRIRVVGNDWRPLGSPPWPLPVHHTGYVSHEEALREMRSASVLLHYEDPANPAPGGKIYEYLASGRPVLCVARPDGGAAALVRAAQAGPVVAPDDGEEIERALMSLYERWQTSGLPDQPAAREFVLQHYSRRKLARDLAAVLDHAAGIPPRPASAGGRPMQAGQATPLDQRIT
jgi:glycosyltransferase involved in cell wall biosynthesis